MTTAYPYILVVNAKIAGPIAAGFRGLGEEQTRRDELRNDRIGAANHLVTSCSNGKAGLKMAHIPYRGTALRSG